MTTVGGVGSIGFIAVDPLGRVTSASGWIEAWAGRALVGLRAADLVIAEHRSALEIILGGDDPKTLGFLPDDRGVPTDVLVAAFVIDGGRVLSIYRAPDDGVVERLGRMHEALVEAQRELAARNDELEKANEAILESHLYIRKLEGILPICAGCGHVRSDDDSNWLPLKDYLTARGDVRLSHGYCPECAEAWLGETEEVL